MISKWDRTYIGAICGLIAPVILMLLYWQMNYGTLTFEKFVAVLIKGNIHVKLISLFTVINLALFFLFIWRNLNYSARGVLLATFIYIIIVVFLKYF